MKRLTRWLVRRYLPSFVLIEKTDTEEYFRELSKKHMPGYHLARNPPKGVARKKRGEG